MDERLDLLGRWRETDEIEGNATEPGSTACSRRRFEAGLFQPGQDEEIDRLRRPRLVTNARQGLTRRRPEGPEAPRRLAIKCRRSSSGLGLAWIGSAVLDPFLEISANLVRQLAAGRHFEIFVTQRFQQQAGAGISRHQSWSARAALAQAVTRVEQEAALDLGCIRGVAAVAVLDQHRADVLLKELELAACLRGRSCRR